MRTHYCGEINEALVGQEIEVCGWVHRRRDHGGVIFIDLRDREGLLQVVFDPDRPEIFAEAERIRSEYVLKVKGLVRLRPEGTINPNMRTGQIEVLAHELETLNKSETPPFHHDEQANEELRLKYRYLDLRRADMLGNLRLRLTVNGEVRQDGSTADMLFGVPFLVSYISNFMTLLPGDIIPTGTPPGVGLGLKPPVFLKAGNVMTLGISGLGEQRQEVVAFSR